MKKLRYIKIYTVLIITTSIALVLPLHPRKPIADGMGWAKNIAQKDLLQVASYTPHKPMDKVPINAEDYVRNEANKYGWGDGAEWAALHRLITNESGWRWDAMNASSGACGLFQALPCSKLGAPIENVSNQAAWGLGYIKARYGSPSQALSFWLAQSPHWY